MTTVRRILRIVYKMLFPISTLAIQLMVIQTTLLGLRGLGLFPCLMLADTTFMFYFLLFLGILFGIVLTLNCEYAISVIREVQGRRTGEKRFKG